MPKQLSRATPMSQNRNEQSAKHQTQALSPSAPPMTKAGIRLARRVTLHYHKQAMKGGQTRHVKKKKI